MAGELGGQLGSHTGSDLDFQRGRVTGAPPATPPSAHWVDAPAAPSGLGVEVPDALSARAGSQHTGANIVTCFRPFFRETHTVRSNALPQAGVCVLKPTHWKLVSGLHRYARLEGSPWHAVAATGALGSVPSCWQVAQEVAAWGGRGDRHRVLVPGLPHSGCVTLGKLLNFSEP